jgi:plastocyanin
MISTYLAGAVCAVAALSASAADYSVSQTSKAFSVRHLKVKTGDTVNFVNNDPFFHNIYSLSETKTFDLGSYPKGQGRKVTFDQPGTVEVECAIHPSMKMTVEVVK